MVFRYYMLSVVRFFHTIHTYRDISIDTPSCIVCVILLLCVFKLIPPFFTPKTTHSFTHPPPPPIYERTFIILKIVVVLFDLYRVLTVYNACVSYMNCKKIKRRWNQQEKCTHNPGTKYTQQGERDCVRLFYSYRLFVYV